MALHTPNTVLVDLSLVCVLGLLHFHLWIYSNSKDLANTLGVTISRVGSGGLNLYRIATERDGDKGGRGGNAKKIKELKRQLACVAFVLCVYLVVIAVVLLCAVLCTLPMSSVEWPHNIQF